MNNTLKRLLSLAMAVVLVMTCGVMPVSADEGESSEHTHVWADGSCTVEGCGATCDHAGATVTETAPTCAKPGARTSTCGTCGMTLSTETIPATGAHVYDETTGLCACGAVNPNLPAEVDDEEEEEEEEAPHTCNFTEEVSDTATCTAPGVKTMKCACGETQEVESPAKGHAYGDGTVTTEPTCANAGVLTKTCGCGETTTETIPATGNHNYVDGTCTVCTAAEPSSEPEAEHTHEWNQGEVTLEALCTDTGVMIYTCLTEGCGETRTETIPAQCTDEVHAWECPFNLENPANRCTLTEGCQLLKGHEQWGAPCDVGVPFVEFDAAQHRVKVGAAGYTSLQDAYVVFNAATDAVTVEIYGEVEFVNGMELKGAYSSISFVGKTANAKITINQSAGGDYLEAHGKSVSFEDLILAKANPAWSGNSGHMGNYFSIQGGTITYTHCTFPNGACANTSTATYNNCTFQNSSEYGLWVYDDALVTVNGGTIDSAKGIKVYSEGETSVTSTLTVQNATFTENVTVKPAVAIGYAAEIKLIGNTYNNSTSVLELDSGSDADCEGVNFVAQDASGNDISNTLSAVDRSNSNAPCGVLMDGKIYTTVTSAKGEADTDSKVTILYNTDENVEFPVGTEFTTPEGISAPNVTAPDPVAKIGEKSYVSLQAAIDAVQNGETITLVEDCDEVITFTQTADKSFVLDGGNKTYTGSINITARAGKDAASTLTIQNFNFTTDKTSYDFIKSVETNYYPNNVTISGCTFTGTGNIQTEGYAVVAVRMKSANNLTIQNCTGTGLHSFLQNTAGWDIELDNVDVTNSLGGFAMGSAQGVTIKNCDLDVTDMGIRIDAQYAATTTIQDCNVKSFIPVVVRKASADHKLVITGTNTMTQTNTDGYWCVIGADEYKENGKLPTDATGKITVKLNDSGLKTEGVYGFKIHALEGEGTAQNPYLIYNKEELFFFAEKVNDGTYSNVNVKLVNDIDLEQDDWTSIGTSAKPFTGTFDGNGKTISNLYSVSNGLFGQTSTGNYVDSGENGRATIKNLTLNGVAVYNQSTNAVGGVVGQARQNTEISNVKVTGTVQVYGSGYVGGIVGQGYVHVDNCHVDGTSAASSQINASYWAVGGIVGHAGSEGGASISNCSVKNVTITSAVYGAGAIAGVGTEGTISNIEAENVKVVAGSSADANGFLVGCNYDKITGDSTTKNVTLTVAGQPVNEPQDMVAVANNTYYATLDKAVAAGGNVKLLNDVTLTDAVNAGSNVALDLNGKTVTGKIVAAGENVTVKNGTVNELEVTGTLVVGLDSNLTVGTLSGNGKITVNAQDIADPKVILTYTNLQFDPANVTVNKAAGEKEIVDIVPMTENSKNVIKVAKLPLPTATVGEITKPSDMELTFALNFFSDDITPEQKAYFGGWFADFELTLNKDATFNSNSDSADGYLAGEYGTYGWIAVPWSDVTIQSGTPLKIMETASTILNQSGLQFTYGEVYELVKSFNCGIFFTEEFLNENPDLEVTLELKMYKDASDDGYVIGKTYEFEAPYEAFIDSDEDGVWDEGETKFATIEDAIKAAEKNAAESGDKNTTVVIADDYEKKEIEVPSGITLTVNGTDIQMPNGGTMGYDNSGNPEIVPTLEDNKVYGTVKIDGNTYQVGVGASISIEKDGDLKFNDAKNDIVDVSSGKYQITKVSNVKNTTITQGSTYYTGTSSRLVFECNGFFELFDHLEVDGVTLSKSQYEVEKGSTILSLRNRYLKTLDVDNYKLTIYYTNGMKAETEFRVKNSPSVADETNPKTGDFILMSMAIMTLSAAALAVLLIGKKKHA